jgi:predicted RNase H-like HicB family nuclease
MELTTVFEKVSEGYIAWVEELPGANTQGETLTEARENIIEAIQMVLEANHEMLGTPLPSEFSIKEKVALAAV